MEIHGWLSNDSRFKSNNISKSLESSKADFARQKRPTFRRIFLRTGSTACEPLKVPCCWTNSMNETSSRVRKGPKWPIIMIYFLLVVTCYRVNQDNATIMLHFRGWINYRIISENKKWSNHKFLWWSAKKC